MYKIKNRYEFVNKYLVSWEKKNVDKLVLDAGAGERRIKGIFKKNKYISQDFGEYKHGKDSTPPDFKGTWDKKWESDKCDILCDITNIPLEDNSINLITCLEVIEHLPEPLKALKELSRIIQKDGLILISCPNLCSPHQQPFFFYSGFSRELFENYIPAEFDLKIEKYYEEGDFIKGHFDQLNTLSISSNNFLIRLLLKFSIKISEIVIKFLLKISGTKFPAGCSGFVIIYKKN